MVAERNSIRTDDTTKGGRTLLVPYRFCLDFSGALDVTNNHIDCSFLNAHTHMGHQCRLPASFTSLYRLFLRTASASVLHHRSARLNLITRWRPVFDAAAKVTKELEYSPQDSTSTWRQERIDWLKIWNERGRFV